MTIKERMKKILPLIIGIFILIVAIVFYFTQTNKEQTAWEESDEPFQQMTTTNEEQTEETGKIMVDIKGEVNKPGVYELTGDARVKEVILEAGGFTKSAEEKQLNLAEKLSDQQMIYVPNKTEAEEMEVAGEVQEESQTEEMIDINAADLTELQELSGIGPAKAQDIIDYREENGPFETVDELNEVSGFGEKTVEKLRESIKI
ncbi:helix-hairpin-helix domain-containing protein [Tetragenococcus koreensis]|uniref:Competence protein ComEA n=1 Tax=Tetragenococcus koreensis TaxID=290335 RepID=A0AAN4RKS9_9ENTE|nr:helix-hairpin-helix domain-containing protein [Tetragenococcus koreensis]MCF1584352.1 helix-hairpin-helix domain-containing protein [Tetragenococcus koreensis]MCF1613901.1 helix-hairpin-helix domain-containing protein [Tetragenococcus koreensis]MCF1616092.1 helix-hairpin-helix domain-containing protein [Tetragenococcus koreensis]MCF1618556.1 helix-hairpin-helix domain-containing protein [Tetragenococcus koreensis]MCF1621157.1 helix-hairpin-helix domain-containing protein [Tetragenococcus ko